MTLKAIFRWKNPDSTADLNQRQAQLVNRGVIWGGEIQPGVGLTVNVTPSVAHSLDGMTVLEDTNQQLNVYAGTTGQTNVIVLHAKYNAGGSPSQPTLNWHVYEESVYNGHPDKDYLIVYGKVILAGGAVSVTLNDIDTTERDEVNPVGRDWFRGKVATTGDLPLPPPHINREGDFYYVQGDNTFYFWDGLAWTAQSSGSFATETVDFNRDVVRRERDRLVNGSGVVSGTRWVASGTNGAGGLSRRLDVNFIPDASQDSMMGFDSFMATVNGHVVETHAQLVQLDPKADRYDLVFLELWREEVADPDAVTYERNPDGSTTYTIKQASELYEQLLWRFGLTAPGDNFSLKELSTDDHKFVVTKYRFGKITGCGQDAIARPTDPTVVGLALNIDGIAFSAPGPAVESDSRTWHASSTTAYDGVSWAIPISVIRRTTSEDHTTTNGIKEFRDNIRYIFPVYPVTDLDIAARRDLDTQNLQDAVAYKYNAPNKNLTQPNAEPSGFLTGLDYDIIPSSLGTPNAIEFYKTAFKTRIRGIEDWLYFGDPFTGSVDVDLGGAPSTGYRRDFVYIKMNITVFADYVYKPNYWISPKHRPLFGSDWPLFGAALFGQGYKRGYVTYELVVADVGTALDEDKAMAALGYSRGDASLASMFPGTDFQYNDGGLWSKSIALMEDDRVHPLLAEWAIPVCLVHRRNSAAWTFDTNPNGTGLNRPDDRQSAGVPHPDDWVDMRHMVDVSEEDMNAMLEADIERLMKGQLRTRMAEKWAGGGTGGDVAGSRILQTDTIGPIAGAFNLVNPDGSRTTWSDAREFQVVARAWDMAAPAGSPTDVFQYTPGSPGTLIIRAPAGAHIIRQTPSIIAADNDPAGANYLKFNSEVCWSTRDQFDTLLENYPSPSEGKRVVAGTFQESTLPVQADSYTVLTADDYGRPIEVQYDISASADLASASWWVHYDRVIDLGLTYPYNINYGLAEIPDEVHKLTKGPTSGSPSEVNLGTLYAVVRKTGISGISTTITAADVLAASGVSGTTAVLMGCDFNGISYSTAPPALDSKNTIMNSARDQITITWNAPYTGDIEVIVYFETDYVDEWVEISRGSKAIRGYFKWHEQIIDYGVGAPQQAFTLNTKIWQNAEVGDTFRQMPLIWTANSPTGPWELVNPLPAVGFRAGYRYSNMVSLSDRTTVVPSTQQYVMVIVPVVEPAANAVTNYLQVDYTYTPYQGLSANGGNVANVGTALPVMKEMLHGEVVANSDFYATQSGPCSHFGGVDAWSGWPARIPNPILNFGSARFTSYNCTSLVKPAASRSVVEWSHTDKRNLNAAAVLRLPFPSGYAMAATVSPASQRNMDFELDPGRDGAAAGHWSFAPGYPGAVNSSRILIDQFVNGLSRLAIRGSRFENRRSYLLTAASYQSGHNGEAYTHVPYTAYPYLAWEAAPSNSLWADCDLRPPRGEIVANVFTAFNQVYEADFQTGVQQSGVRVTSAEYPNMVPIDPSPARPASYLMSGVVDDTFPGTMSNSQVLYSVTCGTVMAYFVARNALYSALSAIRLENSADPQTRQLLSTKVVLGDDLIQSTLGAVGVVVPIGGQNSLVHADVIRLPFGSGSYYGQDESLVPFGEERRVARSTGRTSLKGTHIRYPESWSSTMITALEALIQPSTLFHSTYGRGLYLGNTDSHRYTMPVLVPGSGIPISYIAEASYLVIDDNAEQPEMFPVQPTESIFDESSKKWVILDHGGKMAYVFYGIMINPESDSYQGRAVMQISGGPTSAVESPFLQATTYPEAGSEQVDGTALDAFWPTHRPVLKKK